MLGPQRILWQGELLRHGMSNVMMSQPDMVPIAKRRIFLLPSRAFSAWTLQQGRMALVDIPAQLTALQTNSTGHDLRPAAGARAHASEGLL